MVTLFCIFMLSMPNPVQLRVTTDANTPVVIIIDHSKLQWVYDEPNDMWKLAAIVVPAKVKDANEIIDPNIFDPNTWAKPVVIPDDVKTVTANWLNPYTMVDFARAANAQ